MQLERTDFKVFVQWKASLLVLVRSSRLNGVRVDVKSDKRGVGLSESKQWSAADGKWRHLCWKMDSCLFLAWHFWLSLDSCKSISLFWERERETDSWGLHSNFLCVHLCPTSPMLEGTASLEPRILHIWSSLCVCVCKWFLNRLLLLCLVYRYCSEYNWYRFFFWGPHPSWRCSHNFDCWPRTWTHLNLSLLQCDIVVHINEVYKPFLHVFLLLNTPTSLQERCVN